MLLAGISPSSFLLLTLCLWASPLCHGGESHNITSILAANPDFTEFSAALTTANLTAEIDSRTTITVLAVDNAAMAQLKARHLQPDNFRYVLSLHVLLDYLDDAKLHGLPARFTLTTTLFQASGHAPGSAGILNITAPVGGRVAFAPYGTADAPPAVFYDKSIKESPYDIAVLQVSAVISSPAAQGPAFAPPPPASFMDLMSKNGCGAFAGLVTSTANAADTMYHKSIDGGLTIFCPDDKAVAAFSTTFKNLTGNSQLSLLLYHAVAAHYSQKALKKINGDVNTLAADTDGVNNLTIHEDGDTVKLSSSRSVARVTKTILDKANLSIYVIDAMLLPSERRNGSGTSPAPAPAPSPKSHPAPPPNPAHTPDPTPKPVNTPAPAPAAEQPPADEKGQHKNRATGSAQWSLSAVVAAAVAFIVL